MSLTVSESRRDPCEVVIAGGGVAALETVLALHHLAPGRVRMCVLAPGREFVHRPLAVAEPFDRAVVRRWPLGAIAADHGAIHVRDTLAAVDADAGCVETGAGRTLGYDALLVAVGARAEVAVDGALTFEGPASVEAMRDLLAAAERGSVRSIAFAVPRHVSWTLPLYELALMTAAHLSGHGARGIALSVVSPERSPLEVFGRRASDTVAALLRDGGVDFRRGAPERTTSDGLRLADGRGVEADAVVAMPRLVAPEIPGLPLTSGGLVPTDLHSRVDGVENVYAAGDITWYPIKQGGIAAQQADAAAQAIAAAAGAHVAARPFRPVLRGILLTGGDAHYLRSGEEAATSALWHPRSKVAGRYLGPYLAGSPERVLHDRTADEGEGDGVAIALALDAADANAGWSDYPEALRWLDVAEGLAIALPGRYADKRREWAERICETAR